MQTIYEKEIAYESLDASYKALKSYVEDAVGQEAIHEVELGLFRRVLKLARGFLEFYVEQSGSGYEADNPPCSQDGHPLIYKGIKPEGSPYQSIFGEIKIWRASYAHPDGGRVYPIDEQLNLPANKYSYVLLKWLQASSADQDFRTAVEHLNEIFGFNFFPSLPQRQGLPLAAYVESFYDQVEAPNQQEEGSHIAMSADCKGVRILKSEREASCKAQDNKARLGRGEKPGIKKDAVVVTDFSFDPEPRRGEEIVKGLLNQFTEEEKEKVKKDRQHRREEGLGEPRAPLKKHVFATLDGKKAAFLHMLDHIEKRDPAGKKPLVGLLDGEPALENGLLEELKARNMTQRLDALILDIIHASEYLWDVGTALYGEKGSTRIKWIESKLYALVDGKVGYLIGGLRQMLTKKQNQLTQTQIKALKKTITYFHNHQHMMAYDVYLNKGYPIATGVIEGTCGSLVKDRMEQSGMRWAIVGAQAVLAQRAVIKNGDWDDFFDYFIQSEKYRLYPQGVFWRREPYKTAA